MAGNVEFSGIGDIIRVPLFLIQVLGQHPGKKFKFSNLLILINSILVVMIIICDIIEMKANLKIGLTAMLNSIQNGTLLLQVLIKSCVMFFNRNILASIFEQSQKFLQLSQFDEEVQNECRRIFKIIKTNSNLYLSLVATTATFFVFDPYISGNLPFAGYYPPNWRTVFLILHYHLCWVSYCTLMGFDTVLFAVSCETFIQFKLLHRLILQLTGEDCGEEPAKFRERIKRIVDHQNFLMDYTLQINKLSSIVFFYQFSLTIIASCVQLFIILQPGFTNEDKIKCVLFMMGQLYEFAMYCGWSEAISTAVSEVADAAYNTDWYKVYDQNWRKDLVMIILKAQKVFVFTGGNGFVRLNIATFTIVFKSVLSFYAFLNTIQAKNE